MTYAGDCDDGRTPAPSDTIGDVAAQDQTKDGTELLEKDVDRHHPATLMCEEHVKYLQKSAIIFSFTVPSS